MGTYVHARMIHRPYNVRICTHVGNNAHSENRITQADSPSTESSLGESRACAETDRFVRIHDHVLKLVPFPRAWCITERLRPHRSRL